MSILSKIKFYGMTGLLSYGKLKAYIFLKKTDKYNAEEIENYQNSLLKKMITYSYENIPFYNKLYKEYNVDINDVKSIGDLHKLPIITKRDIIDNYNDLYPENNNIKYVEMTTGGSTGEPLKYRISQYSSDISFALLLRGWGFAGYKPGDKMAIIAGGSLVGKASPLKNKIRDYIFNFRRYSSYGMNEELLKEYVDDMIKWKPKYLRGYASIVFLLAEYVKKYNLESNFHLNGIFTTAEMLFKNQRDVIESVFDTKVYDTYGLNDGGITAFECSKQNGFHIDIERAILEVVDEDGNIIYEKEGRVIATSLNEYAMPLLRYDTGDLGVLSKERCSCGCDRPLLKELKGRVTDTLKFNDNFIGSPVIATLMGKINAKQYQFIQLSKNKLLIKIIKGDNHSKKDEDFIKQSLFSNVGQIDIEFEYVDNFNVSSGKKHKFIIKMDG